MKATEFGIVLVIPRDSRKSVNWWKSIGSVQLETIVRSHHRRVHGAIRTKIERGPISRIVVVCDTRPEVSA